MIHKYILSFIVVGILSTVSQAQAKISGTAVFNGLKWVASVAFEPNEAVAQAGSVVVDTTESRQKGWYANAEFYDHTTIKNGYQSAPISTLNGQSTTHHIVEEIDYEYYDIIVFQIDPYGHLYNPQMWFGHQFWEPTVYIQDPHYYVEVGTTKKWDTKHRVFSNYSNASGDQNLRNPGTYNVTVHYSLSDVSITPNGLLTVPRSSLIEVIVPMSAIQNDDSAIDLLPRATKINITPYATGKIERYWGWEFVQNAPPNPYVGESIGVKWTVKEKIEP